MVSSTMLGSGGAIYSSYSNIHLEMVIFEANEAPSGGAVSYFAGSYLRTFSCIFTNNTAFIYGGAMYIETSSAATFDGRGHRANHFQWNRAPIAGAVNAIHSGVTFMGTNIFSDNNATVGAGGLSLTKCTDRLITLKRGGFSTVFFWQLVAHKPLGMLSSHSWY